VLFVVGQANAHERTEMLEAIFDKSREDLAIGVKKGTVSKAVLAAYDYVYDIAGTVEETQSAAG
jgi:hypothetical protein